MRRGCDEVGGEEWEAEPDNRMVRNAERDEGSEEFAARVEGGGREGSEAKRQRGREGEKGEKGEKGGWS